jgi:hypothetical protein
MRPAAPESDTDTLQGIRRGRRVVRPSLLVGLGVFFIFGGETFCILGPMQYQPVIHVVCHAILYSGMGLAGLGAILHWRGKPQTRSTGPPSGTG